MKKNNKFCCLRMNERIMKIKFNEFVFCVFLDGIIVDLNRLAFRHFASSAYKALTIHCSATIQLQCVCDTLGLERNVSELGYEPSSSLNRT